MADVYPDGWQALAATGAAARELETLRLLGEGLGDGYTVYHGVHWTRVEKNDYAIFGEIDFAIVGPTGKLLLIEQKAGLLVETIDGLVKRYPGKEKNVSFQLGRNVDALTTRLRQACKGDAPQVDSILYCPDYRVQNPGSAGIDPARIVDASRRDQLLAIVRRILPPDGDVLAAKPVVLRFLADTLQLVPEVNAIVGEAKTLYTRLSAGLAHWARQIECDPFRLRVVGTAGSGKTQLAMAVYRDAIAAGRRPLYVCFNRPLADHVELIAPPGGDITTYHQLGYRVMRAAGTAPDFGGRDAFARMEAALDQYRPAPSEQWGEFIVDEGQDFQAGWAENLLRCLAPGGRAWWLEDPMQNLYGRPSVALPGWVTLHADINHRTPRDILHTLNRMLPLERPVESGSPLAGSEVNIVSYGGTRDLLEKTASAITEAIGLGFKRPHIAVITYRGRENSRFTPFEQIGPYRLRSPTGQYDLFGNAVYTEGDILLDSVYRFKGRAAPCVILTEIDFERLDDRAVRRIFVGATRATMKLTLVVSEASAKVLLERLGDERR